MSAEPGSITGANTLWSLASCGGGVIGVLGVGGVAPQDESISPPSSLICGNVGVLGVVASDVGWLFSLRPNVEVLCLLDKSFKPGDLSE